MDRIETVICPHPDGTRSKTDEGPRVAVYLMTMREVDAPARWRAGRVARTWVAPASLPFRLGFWS